MPTQLSEHSVIFPTWYDARAEAESTSKGFLPGVEVRLGDSRYPLYFIDPVRLRQTLEDDARDGRPYFSEPGLVLVPEVTTQAVQDAIAGLIRDGYFGRQDHLLEGA